MAKEMHKTPNLDALEAGPWRSFVTGLKRLGKDKDYGVDLVGQLGRRARPERCPRVGTALHRRYDRRDDYRDHYRDDRRGDVKHNRHGEDRDHGRNP